MPCDCNDRRVLEVKFRKQLQYMSGQLNARVSMDVNAIFYDRILMGMFEVVYKLFAFVNE